MIFSVLGDNDARGARERNLIGLVRLLPSVALPKGKVAYSTWLPSTELSGAGFPDPDCGSLTQATNQWQPSDSRAAGIFLHFAKNLESWFQLPGDKQSGWLSDVKDSAFAFLILPCFVVVLS